MKDIKWILPGELAKLEVWRGMFFVKLSQDERVSMATGKRAISASLTRKFDLIRDANGDILYLYMSPVITDELILMTSTQHDRTRTSDQHSEVEWYGKYLDFVFKTSDENARREAHGDLNVQISSFFWRRLNSTAR